MRRRRPIVGEHHGRRAVPGNDIPRGGSQQGRARLQRIENALQPQRDALALLVMRLGGPSEAEQEKMLALDLRQHQCACDPIEHIGRRRAAAALLETGLAGGADAGALCDFLAAQSGSAAASGGKAEHRGINLGAAILQIGAERVAIQGITHPDTHHTRIMSLLYDASRRIDSVPPMNLEV